MYEWLTEPRIAWFLFGLALMLGEVLMPGIVLLFFGAGAWTVVVSLTIISFGLTLQLAIFIIASFAFLALFRSRVEALFRSKGLHLNNSSTSLQNETVGQEVDVVETIAPPHPGRVLLHGTLWQAKASEFIPAGSRVRIVRQEVLLLTVKRLP